MKLDKLSKIHKCKAKNTTTSFNFLPYSKGQSLTFKKHWKEYINMCVCTPHRKI